MARDQLLGRPVAVKVLFPEYAADPKFVERFRREAQAAANLNHPNIVSIYDWGEELGTYYIVMEYVEGQSLAQILRREVRLTPEQVTRVALDVAHALGFAHDGGVVHRDVKPGNVLVSPKGDMKVADFGIATAMSSNADANLTQTGAVMGTATYFSPEQAQGHKVDHRSDLYSLGVLMYEMLVGQPPFTGETPVSIAYKHVQEPVTPVTAHGVDIPPALAAITMKLLSKNPDNRYPSAAALLADLDRFRRGQEIEAAAAAGVLQPMTRAGAPGAYPTNATTALPMQPGQRPVVPVTYQEPPRRRAGLIMVGVLTTGLILAGFLILLQAQINKGNDDDNPAVETAEQVEIESLAGRLEADARSSLERLGLIVESRLLADNTVPVGQVIKTEPAAGARVDVGSAVVMFVSSGASLKQVPSVVTLSENDALRSISAAGFQPQSRNVPSEIAPEGEVVGQNPPAGTLAEPGSFVEIEVSAGIEEKPVPDVRGLDLSAARTVLEDEGFVVSDQMVFENDEEIAIDFVLGSIPAAGEKLEPGGSIRLVVSDGPEELMLPNVIGLTTAEAFLQLEELGLLPIPLEQFVSDPALVGVVVQTLPAPNSIVRPGDQIQVISGLLVPDSGDPGVDGQGEVEG